MKGSEVDVGLVMETHGIEGVWAKGIPGFETGEMVLGGERSSVGVVYMEREGVYRTWYDTIMDWLKKKNQ